MILAWLIPLIVIIIFYILMVWFFYLSYRFGWYNELKKPPCHFDWVFHPIWFLVYAIIFYSWYSMFGIGISLLFLAHLGFLVYWAYTFFYYRNFYQSLYILVIAIVILLAILTIALVYDNPLPSLLLAAYAFYLVYLCYLNWQIGILNVWLDYKGL